MSGKLTYESCKKLQGILKDNLQMVESILLFDIKAAGFLEGIFHLPGPWNDFSGSRNLLQTSE